MIEQVDYLVRLIAVGAGLLLLAQLVAGEIRAKVKFPVVAMIVGVIAYLLSTSPMATSPGLIDPWLDLVALSVPFSVWLFARNLFEREAPDRTVLIVAGVLVAAWFVGSFLSLPFRLGFYVVHIVSLGLIADLVRVAFIDRQDDLVEQRRAIRLWLPLLVAAQAGTVLIADLVIAPSEHPPAIKLFNSLMILSLTLFAGLALFRTDAELLIESEEDGAEEEREAALDLSPGESVLHDKLKAAMAQGLFREPGLSIAALADRLDTPEHRLRALINRRLGYRNFSAFLNHHRINEAREKLASREEVDLPVLTIAMDLGYNSLPTFNRAFRNETGTTPSEYRRLAISGSGAEGAVQK
jgi:AraC-like DNA-binding protein